MFVMVAFTIMMCFWANQSPAAPAAPAPEKSSTAAAASAEEESPGFIEQEESTPVVKKGKKFPWLIVGAVVVIGAAAVYFLVVKKPKYTLTVSLGGATGTPAATEKFKKGAAVAYNYAAQSGYVNLEVKLDGTVVPASGTVTMDADHSLTATAVQGSAIQVSSNPAGAQIFVNNSNSGFTTPHTFLYTTAVTRTVLLRQCGYKDYSKTVTAALGQTVTVETSLVQGLREEFTAPAASCWAPRVPGNWTTSAGVYKMKTNVSERDFSCYGFAFPVNFTLEVKLKLVKGNTSHAIAVTLADTSNMTAFSGYAFQFIPSSKTYSVWKYQNKNYISGTSTSNAAIKSWTSNSHVHGLNQWNTMKIVRAGSSYSLYFDNTLVFSFSDSTYNARYVCLNAYINSALTEMQYDYVHLDVSGAAVPTFTEPAPAAQAITSVDENGI
ncbi:MAG: PEGA domain-containing protein [Chrysiogenales bacterium]|nr:MAG: PEGA domain-containing protein [Chrysiogenales bacterium]